MRILIALLFATLPLRAVADVDCSVIDALERIQFAQLRLSTAPQISANATDAQLIIREVSRLDNAKVRFASQTTLTTLDQARLIAFFEVADVLRQTLLSARMDQTQNILHAASFAQHQANAKRILPLFKCNDLSGVRGTDGLEKVSSTIDSTKSARKITLTSSVLWLLGVIIACLGAMQIKSTLAARQTRKKRRAKRYHVHITSQIRRHDEIYGGTILDISCNGVKIQADLPVGCDTGEHVDIWIGKQWKTANISWSNAHYTGLRFAHALPHEFVIDLHKVEQKSLRKRKNGARLGAVFNTQR